MKKEASEFLLGRESLYVLSEAASLELWGREPGFPVVLFPPERFDAEACERSYDDFMDLLEEMEAPLFDECGWRSRRFAPMGLVGVFDEPESPQLGADYPFVDQMDGLLMWDSSRGGVVLLEVGSTLDEGLEEVLTLVASSLEALQVSLSKPE